MDEKEYEKHTLHGWHICEDAYRLSTAYFKSFGLLIAYVVMFPFFVLGYILETPRNRKKR